MTYHWLRIRTDERGWQNAYARFGATELPDGLDVWGAFFGLFGIGSNELVLVLHCDGPAPTVGRRVLKLGLSALFRILDRDPATG